MPSWIAYCAICCPQGLQGCWIVTMIDVCPAIVNSPLVSRGEMLDVPTRVL